MNKDNISNKDQGTALSLCLLLGIFGVHRFYVGKWFTGFLWFFTGGFLLLGWIIDLKMLTNGTFTDAEGRYVRSEEINSTEDVIEIDINDLDKELEIPLDEYDDVRIEIEQ